MDKIEFSFESFKNLQELIRFADQKAGGVFVLAGVIVTAFLDATKELKIVSPGVSTVGGMFLFVLGVLVTLLLAASVYLVMYRILRPRFAGHYDPDVCSPLYFEHVAMLSDKKILFNKLINSNDQYLVRSLADQIYELSKILKLKLFYLRRSVDCVFASAISLVLFILLERVI